VQLLLDAQADVNVATSWGATPLSTAALTGLTKVVQMLLAAPQLATGTLVHALGEAVAWRPVQLAMDLLKALMSRDMDAAAAELARHPSLAGSVLQQWQAAEGAVRQEEARWPALQQRMVGVALAHQQLRAAAAGTVTSVTVGIAAVQAAAPESGDT
jgi:hypothetical protein